MSSHRTARLLIVLAIVAIVAAAAWWYTGRAQVLSVGVISAERGEVLSTVSNTRAGTVDACRRAGMSPPLGGQIAKLPVRKGDRVVTGQVMLELWNEDLRAELELAKRDAVASRGRRDEVCVRGRGRAQGGRPADAPARTRTRGGGGDLPRGRRGRCDESSL